MLIPYIKSKRDLITGLKTRTIAGRPNWDKVFKQVHNTECNASRVRVFWLDPDPYSEKGRIDKKYYYVIIWS